MVIVIGPVGIGKLCVVREFVCVVEGPVIVVVGCCLFYGVGVMFGLVVEIVG